jgi:hypothetical protein
LAKKGLAGRGRAGDATTFGDIHLARYRPYYPSSGRVVQFADRDRFRVTQCVRWTGNDQDATGSADHHHQDGYPYIEGIWRPKCEGGLGNRDGGSHSTMVEELKGTLVRVHKMPEDLLRWSSSMAQR